MDVPRRASSAGRMLTDAHADMMRRDAVCGGRRAVVTQKLILRELKNVAKVRVNTRSYKTIYRRSRSKLSQVDRCDAGDTLYGLSVC